MKDLRKKTAEMVKVAEAQGFRVEDRGTCWIVYGKTRQDGVVNLHKTPSDIRAIKNSRSYLRRIGVDI